MREHRIDLSPDLSPDFSLIWNESIETETDIRKPGLTEEKIIAVLAEQEPAWGRRRSAANTGLVLAYGRRTSGGGAISILRELKRGFWSEVQRFYEKRICTSLPSSLRIT